jgi:hypothetical protein
MNVYVESNFVLEHALEQEECDSCSEIIQLASQGRITLLIPAFSLAEPHQVIASKAKARSRLSAELSAQLGELGRSKPHRDMPSTFGVLPVASVPNTPHRLFQGRPVYHNSIFVDDACPALFPQMDVWPRCHCVGLAKGSRTVRNTNYPPARRTYSAESRGISVSP